MLCYHLQFTVIKCIKLSYPYRILFNRMFCNTIPINNNNNSKGEGENINTIQVQAADLEQLIVKGCNKLESKLVWMRKNNSTIIDMDHILNMQQDLKIIHNKLAYNHNIMDLSLKLKNIEEKYGMKLLKWDKLHLMSNPSLKKKAKEKENQIRIPYLIYKSQDGINIRVGRTAKDNDLLSMNQKYRKDKYWWLHTSGHSGSHVVICSEDDELPIKYKETLLDAALLALFHSSINTNTNTHTKNSNLNVNVNVDIHYTRCGNISKNMNDPIGLVRLGSGSIGKISINRKYQKDREIRLLASVFPVNYNDLLNS